MPAGGHGWEGKVCRDVTVDFAGVELQDEDPARVAALWSGVLGIPHGGAADDFAIALNNAALRFVPAGDGRGPGLGGVDLKVRDRAGILARAKARDAYVSDACVVLCGTRFNLHDVS
jgi:hypothetical protein